MPNSPAKRPDAEGQAGGIKGIPIDLRDIVSHLVDLILWMETGRGEPPDDAVLRYVRDAVTAKLHHRRRTRELAENLTAIERTMTPSTASPVTTTMPAKAGAAPDPQRRATAPISRPQAESGSGPEEIFYQALLAEETPVHLRCRDGYEVPSAIVRDVSAYALLVETLDGVELFLKRNVISISPIEKYGAPGGI